MDLDPTWLLLALFPSGLGFVLFVSGKKEGRWPQLLVGLVLMIYPYFATTITALVGVGLALVAVLWYVVRAGGRSSAER